MAFREQGVAWVPWVAAWAAAESADAHIPRLLAGASILPPPAPPGTEPPPAELTEPTTTPIMKAAPTVAAAPLGVAGTVPDTPSPAPVAPVVHTQPMPATPNED
jgi:hypothetical protein